MVCSANLRAIGAATQLYLQDHSFIFPAIETDPDPVYSGSDNATRPDDGPSFRTVWHYAKTLQCPADMKSPDGGLTYRGVHRARSYFWKPTLDDEN